MNTLPPARLKRHLSPGETILLGLFALLLLGMVLAACGAASLLSSSAETTALRQSAMACLDGGCDKELSLRLGGLLSGLVRCGAWSFPLAAEPRAVLNAVHAAEVGVYDLREPPTCLPGAAMLAAADRAMARCGWERVVGVCRPSELVAAFVPRAGVTARSMKCCVLVVHESKLIVASARGNVQPLLELARGRWVDEHGGRLPLAVR